MKIKTFTTHTLALLKTPKAIELDFNCWVTQRDIEIVKLHYSVNKRTTKDGTEYEELVLFVFYKQPTNNQEGE